MIDTAERGAVARLHALGLLGVTVLGWLVAAALSGVALWLAARDRAALRTLQAAQALVFQLVAFLGHLLLLCLVALGFVLFGGAADFLPEVEPVDPFAFPGWLLLLVWGVATLGIPVWYVVTLLAAWRATRASARGELYAYRVVGPLVWDSAPRFFRWLRIEGEPDDEESPPHGEDAQRNKEGAHSGKEEEQPDKANSLESA